MYHKLHYSSVSIKACFIRTRLDYKSLAFVMMWDWQLYKEIWLQFSAKGQSSTQSQCSRVKMNVELVAALSQYITVNAGLLPWLLHEDDGL